MSRVYQSTNIGPYREVNEDVAVVLGNETYLVADGMGGYAAGEVASRILADTVRDVLSKEMNFDENVLKKAILSANEAILENVRIHPSYSGMGTTATIFHREEDIIVWAHVGDSRLYLLRNGKLRQITRDHSLVYDLIENGTITPKEAREHPKRNVITRAVGAGEQLDVDMGHFQAAPNDILLLASDGLTSVLSDEEIYALVLDNQSSESDVAERLVQSAIKAGSHDNISSIVVIYDAD